MLWKMVFVVISLVTAVNSVSIGKIEDHIITGISNMTLVNLTREQCICQMMKLNGVIYAFNYFPINQTCQLFTLNNNSISIIFYSNSSMTFINRSSIIITAIATEIRRQVRPPPARQRVRPLPARQQVRPPPARQQVRPLPVRQQVRPPPARQQVRPPPARQQVRPLPARQQVAIGCSVSGATTSDPGIPNGDSVLYTFDNTPNDYYGNYNAVAHNNPQYISPGYNGRGYAIQLLSNEQQYLTVANHMDFYSRSLTVKAWIYPLAIYVGAPYIDMIVYAQTNSSQLYQIMWMMLRNGSGYGAFYGDDVWGPTLFQVKQWQHMAFTYNYAMTTQVIYINGVADATNSHAPPCLITAGIQTIGTYPWYNNGFFHGYVDQLEILMGRAEAAGEILDDATLVAYYTMDCLTYPTFDSGPNQMIGTAVGLISGDGGRVGQSYLFNSTSSYFQITGLVLLGQSYRPFSFAMWLRPVASATTGGTILHGSQYADGTGWCVQFIGLSSSGQIVVNGYSNTSSDNVVGPVLTTGNWVHIVETYSQPHGVRLYVNGILYGQSNAFSYAASGVSVIVTLGQPLSGGSCYQSNIQSGFYIGEIDEFYIYSRELTQADVSALANP